MFKPVKLTYIARPDGKMRPLGLTANDKLVQEVMRIVLEAIYEPVFSDVSFGFRHGLGCHDALNHVEQKFRWCDWVIESVQQAYPTIDHSVLVNIMEKRIGDPRFIRLVWKLLRCGVLDQERMKYSKTGVPQGSIVSPILANIYYHELDTLVQQLQVKYVTNPGKQKSPAYKSLEYQILKLGKEMKHHAPHSPERRTLAKELKSLRQERLKTPSLKETAIRIEYVRYADDWMIGISSKKTFASFIKKKIGLFINEDLKQVIHPTKTSITDLRAGHVHFLGYDIFLPRHRPISTYFGKDATTIHRGQPMLRFELPVAKLTKRYVERGYLKQLKHGIRPISMARYTVLEDHVIVNHYRKVWLGLKNYYMGCTKRNRLHYFHYLLHISCAMTLGHKHRVSCSAIFKKYGKTLAVKVPETSHPVLFPYTTKWRVGDRRWLLGNKVENRTAYYENLITRSALRLPCYICATEGPIEMHHVKHVRKGGFRYKGFRSQMALLNRKQILLCISCHRKVHAGLYDGV